MLNPPNFHTYDEFGLGANAEKLKKGIGQKAIRKSHDDILQSRKVYWVGRTLSICSICKCALLYYISLGCLFCRGILLAFFANQYSSFALYFHFTAPWIQSELSSLLH